MQRMLAHAAMGVSLVASLGALSACRDPAAGVARANVERGGAGPETPLPADAQTLRFSNEGSTVGFTGSKVTGSHDGRFDRFNGTIEFSPSRVEASRVSVTIDTTSVWTDNDQLTTHLRSADFFDVNRFAQSTFRSTHIVAGGTNGATHTITGELSLHGQTRAITFPATIAITPAAVTATAEFSINRREFGINYNGMANNLIRDLVVIRLNLRAARSG